MVQETSRLGGRVWEGAEGRKCRENVSGPQTHGAPMKAAWRLKVAMGRRHEGFPRLLGSRSAHPKQATATLAMLGEGGKGGASLRNTLISPNGRESSGPEKGREPDSRSWGPTPGLQS